jgi:hypothetical protein
MLKYLSPQKIGLVSLLCLLGAAPVHADTDAVGGVLTKLGEKEQEIGKIFLQYQQSKKEADLYVQKAEKAKNAATGLAEDVADPSKLVDKAIQSVPTENLGGISVSNTSSEASVADDVKEIYTRKDNETTQARQRLFAHVRYLTGRNLARMYARAVLLRQNLLEETTPEEDFETKEEAQKAVMSLMLQSAERWNTILETQAYLDEYVGSVEVQNVVRQADESSEE